MNSNIENDVKIKSLKTNSVCYLNECFAFINGHKCRYVVVEGIKKIEYDWDGKEELPVLLEDENVHLLSGYHIKIKQRDLPKNRNVLINDSTMYEEIKRTCELWEKGFF
jgi:hypothetical protein